ncbi:MAG TPA: GNAT family N-acetyltransferase [Kofleriaceae bacterium]|nr:GNAT family N-acetyltransferase [Kofleriaceae bacterium]
MAVEIVPWRPELREHFERVNRIWLEAFDLLEEGDVVYLQRPEDMILAGGGEVFFALEGDRVIGTCAAIWRSGTELELAKLGVVPEAQSRGVGRRLCETVIDLARRSGATRVVLTSNHKLTAALRLYRALGFRDAPVPEGLPWTTVDVYMTLELERA